MKRKRGNAKPKPKKPSLVGANAAIPNVVGLNTDHSLEDLLCEYNTPMETATPQGDTNMSDQQAALEKKVVANERTEDNVSSLRNMRMTVLGNLSKLAASTATKSSRGAATYTRYDSRMETETPRAETNMSGRQTDLEKGGAAVNGMMGFCPNSLRDMIKSIISDLSKEAGGTTAKLSSGIGNNPIRNAPVFHRQGERANQEKSPNQDPHYKEQELDAALSVIKKTMELDAAEPFCVPVDPIALGIPDYFDVIETPMDFGTICYNLENGLKYMNSEDVYKDVQHIWENCCKYNTTGDYILKLMKRVKMNFMKYWTAAGLYKERHQTTDESTMMGGKRRKECSVDHVTEKVAASQVQRHQPSSTYNQEYQPHLSSNEPESLRRAGGNASSTTGYSHMQLPTEPNMRHSIHRHDRPAVPVSDKTGPRQAQSHRPSAIDKQPQLISNHPQPSPRHTEVNTTTVGTTMRHSTRLQERPVGAVTDSAGPRQVQFHGRSSIDNRPQLSSNQPQRSHRQVNANTATSGYSHMQLPTEPNMRHSIHRPDRPAVPVSDKTGPRQAQSHRPSAIDKQPQLISNHPQPSPRHTEVNTTTVGTTMRHSTRLQERPVGAVTDSAGPRQVQFHGRSSIDNWPQLSSNQPQRSHRQVNANTATSVMPKGIGRTNPCRDEPRRVPIVRSQQLQDEPIDEPLSDEPAGDGMNVSSSHALNEDMLSRGTPSTDGGCESIIKRRFRGESRAPQPPENLDQRIPVIIHRSTLVVPEQEDDIKFPSVATGITNAIQGKFVVGEDGPTWKKVSEEMKEYYFREWNRHYKCVENYPERQVKKIWNTMASDQYKLMCHRGRQQFTRSGHPSWCTEQDWNRHLSFYANDKMRKKCEQARKNRNSDRNGLGKTKHAGGSRSFASHELVMIKKNPDKVITEDDVFLRTHKKKQGTGEFVDAKSKKFFEDYTAQKKGTGFDSKAWVDASGGVVKNRLYGFGSLVLASDILSSTAGSSHVCQNEDFTHTQQFEDKVCEKVEQMKDDIKAQIKTQLQFEYASQMEQMKANFQLQLQEAIGSLRGSQHPPPALM